MTHIYVRGIDPSRGGRPPRVSDDVVLAAMPGTVEQLAYLAQVSRSTMAQRLGCLELEGRATREQGHNADGHLCDVWELV